MKADGAFFPRPAWFYSFSFAPNYVAKSIFPSGHDYVKYLYDVAEQFGIVDKIQLNTDVLSTEWIEQDSEWELQICQTHDQYWQTSDSCGQHAVETIRAKVVISAVGVLTSPSKWPSDVQGCESFTGQLLHSARWPENPDLEGKEVVLVGSGCSAAQLAPALLKTKIKSLTQVMRTPPWVVPRLEEPGGQEAYARWAPRIYGSIPGLGLAVRMLTCGLSELLWYAVFQRRGGPLRRKEEAASLSHMRALAPVEYHQMLTPNYQMGCKRRIFDCAWLCGMHDQRFQLETRPWRSARNATITVGDMHNEKVYHADVLILGTGFEATQFLHFLSVIGRNGLSLHGLWATRGGPHAYLGVGVDGFPNFFMVLGPNTFTGHTSVMMAIENSVDCTMRLIKPIITGDVDSIEPRAAVVQTWLEGIRRDMQNTVFSGCQSWYNNGGYNSVMYP